MTQRELNHISNVIWEMVKHIVLSLEAEEEIDLDLKIFYRSPKSP
jgi:hypothetical protein